MWLTIYGIQSYYKIDLTHNQQHHMMKTLLFMTKAQLCICKGNTPDTPTNPYKVLRSPWKHFEPLRTTSPNFIQLRLSPLVLPTLDELLRTLQTASRTHQDTPGCSPDVPLAGVHFLSLASTFGWNYFTSSHGYGYTVSLLQGNTLEFSLWFSLARCVVESLLLYLVLTLVFLASIELRLWS